MRPIAYYVAPAPGMYQPTPTYLAVLSYAAGLGITLVPLRPNDRPEQKAYVLTAEGIRTQGKRVGIARSYASGLVEDAVATRCALGVRQRLLTIRVARHRDDRTPRLLAGVGSDTLDLTFDGPPRLRESCSGARPLLTPAEVQRIRRGAHSHEAALLFHDLRRSPASVTLLQRALELIHNAGTPSTGDRRADADVSYILSVLDHIAHLEPDHA